MMNLFAIAEKTKESQISASNEIICLLARNSINFSNAERTKNNKKAQ